MDLTQYSLTAALDSKSKGNIIKKLIKINRKLKCGIATVSQYLSFTVMCTEGNRKDIN